MQAEAVNNEITKQVTSSWFIFIQLKMMYGPINLINIRIYKTQANSFQYNTEHDRKFSNTIRTKYEYTESITSTGGMTMFENYKNLSRGDALRKAAQQPHYKRTGQPHIQSRCNSEEKTLRMRSLWSVTLENLGRAGKGRRLEAKTLPVSRQNSRSSEAHCRWRT